MMTTSQKLLMKTYPPSHLSQTEVQEILNNEEEENNSTVAVEVSEEVMDMQATVIAAPESSPTTLTQQGRNIRYLSADFRCCLVNCPGCLPCITCQYTSCSSSFLIAFAPSCPKSRSPFFADICLVIIVMILSISSVIMRAKASVGSRSSMIA